MMKYGKQVMFCKMMATNVLGDRKSGTFDGCQLRIVGAQQHAFFAMEWTCYNQLTDRQQDAAHITDMKDYSTSRLHAVTRHRRRSWN
jgi:hypothetical protein